MSETNGSPEIKKDEPRIGVYVCHCGTNIAGYLDVNKVAEGAGGLPNVVVSRDYKYMCSSMGQELIENDIKEFGLNRVVVSACSPTLHEKTFRAACSRAGMNQYQFQMANIREHCSWVTKDYAKATEKAMSIVSAATHRVARNRALQERKVTIKPATLVIGGGIAGIEAALTIANAGKKVYLLEREPSIGGRMAYFDKTFPTLDCAACILTPKMSEAANHPNIELLAYCELEELSGYLGNFKAKIRKKARFINEDLCVGCGNCWEVCPQWRSSEAVKKRKAGVKVFHHEATISPMGSCYIPTLQAVPKLPVIEKDTCIHFKTGKCNKCLEACTLGAVDFDQQDSYLDIEVGTIIIATGTKVFDAGRVKELGWGRLPNVITSQEFEILCNASGPTGGQILMENGEPPKSVAILHCVGSRDENYNVHCSRVCCMYSLKIAHLVREKLEADVYEFYIDMRTPGKGFEEFYHRVMDEGVIMIRGRGAAVSDVPFTPEEEGKLVVEAEDTLLGMRRRVPVDMVILAVGLEPQDDAMDLGRMLGVSCGMSGFFIERHPKLAPAMTMAEGIFLAGTCQGPKDIPDSVAQAGAAAGQALALMDQGEVSVEGFFAEVAEEACSGCRTCIPLCPYRAIDFITDKNVARVNPALCQACGTCVAACPSSAITGQGYSDDQLLAELDGALLPLSELFGEPEPVGAPGGGA
ncbi:MAG: hypothetical protein AMXMBFR61_21290 [Fimbriimonadales bacterium]